MIPQKNNIIHMNEYSNLGNNIDNLREERSINETLKNLNRIENSPNDEVKKEFINKLKNLRVKSYFTDSKNCFQDEFDDMVCLWGNNSSKINGVNISMLDEFIENLKNNDEFIKAYEFEDGNRIKLWIVVRDSISEEADKIYSDFLNKYDDDKYSIMIYDKEVLEHVETQVNFMTNNYRVINKNAC